MTSKEILEANERYHDREAAVYDATLPYMKNGFAQAMFLADVSEIITRLAARGRDIRVLDCGAGTGNLTMKFLDKNCHVTAVDISANMLARLETKARRTFPDCHLRTAYTDIDSFLMRADEQYDVVCSSSFLHHLPDYVSTYERMARMCNSRGVIYTAFEPLAQRRWARSQKVLSACDVAVHEVLCRRYYRPDVIMRAVLRRVGLLDPGIGGDAPEHDCVERPDLGVNADELTNVLKRLGFQEAGVRWRSVKRYLVTQWIDTHMVRSRNALFLIGYRSLR